MMTVRGTCLVLVATLLAQLGQSMPLQMLINQRANECLYDELREGEAATLSLFILAGNSLRATLTIHGPIVSQNDQGIRTGMELQEAVQQFDSNRHRGEKIIQFSSEVNFEHLNIGEMEDEDITQPYANKDETPEERKQRRAEERKKMLELRQKKEQHTKTQKNRVRQEGEPYLKTVRAPATGWYRFCIGGTWNQITAEVDLRKESELGGLDEYGHVWTYRQKVEEEEEDELDKDTAELEGIKDEDFGGTREKLKTLRRLLSDIQSGQNQERHRLAVHAATNEHSHSRMALNSLMETILFMAVTGYQVYTIRKWFKGAPVLGR